MKVDKYSIDGKVVGQVELSDEVFGTTVNDVLIYEMIKAANANLRQGTHKTKERSDVRGSTAKPWRQKGTGRARSGSAKSPIWVGGGTIFGPRPRDYRMELPKKTKAAAYRSLFSLKLKEGSIKVIENFEVSGKTKEMATIAKSFLITKGLLISENESPLLKRSIRNISFFLLNNAKRISSRDIFYSKQVLITEDAIKFINDSYSKAVK